MQGSCACAAAMRRAAAASGRVVRIMVRLPLRLDVSRAARSIPLIAFRDELAVASRRKIELVEEVLIPTLGVGDQIVKGD